MSKLNIKKGDIFSLKESLSSIPANKEENIQITTQEAVKLMADSIKELRAKNYSFEEIANILTERNFPISARALKNALTKKRKYTKRTKKSKKAEQPVDKALDKVAIIKNTSLPNSTKKQQSITEDTSKASSSSFKIRGDSPDL